MNEELAMQHSVQQQMQPEPKDHKALKRIGIVLLTLILIGAIGYGTAVVWKKYSDVKANLSSEQAKNQSLTSKNTALQKEIADKSATPMLTDTLPNGKTITYPDTPGNRNILWWSMDASQPNADTIMLSHKAYQQYLATVDSDLMTSLCGTISKPEATQTNIPYGFLNTTNMDVQPPETKNCVEAIAADTNKDATSRAAAQKVLDTVRTDIDAFLKSAAIK